MRESLIYELEKKFTQQFADMYKRTVFLDTRIRAFETVLTQRWVALRFLFRPEKLMQRINRLHIALMTKHDEEMKKSIDELKTKPKITLVTNGALSGK